MDNAAYVALSRQAGLLKELQVVANNMANISTTGFRREGVVFAEMLSAVDIEGGSLAMTDARARYTNEAQGALAATGGTYDLAVEGTAFLAVMTPLGERLTRAGAFTRSASGEIVSPEGYSLLDNGGAPVFVPLTATAIGIAADGTVSADGQVVAQVGLFDIADQTKLFREDGVRFRAETEKTPAENSTLLQGFQEASNVDPVSEISRMIEVQRAYDLGQNFLDREDDRIRSVVRTLGRAG